MKFARENSNKLHGAILCKFLIKMDFNIATFIFTKFLSKLRENKYLAKHVKSRELNIPKSKICY